jgi:hypothetical protein
VPPSRGPRWQAKCWLSSSLATNQGRLGTPVRCVGVRGSVRLQEWRASVETCSQQIKTRMHHHHQSVARAVALAARAVFVALGKLEQTLTHTRNLEECATERASGRMLTPVSFFPLVRFFFSLSIGQASCHHVDHVLRQRKRTQQPQNTHATQRSPRSTLTRTRASFADAGKTVSQQGHSWIRGA